MAGTFDWTGFSVVAPTADELAASSLPYKHGFLLKEFPTPMADVTTFDDAQDLSNLVEGDFPFETNLESEDITMLSGKVKKGTPTITYPEQTIKIHMQIGMPIYTLLKSYDRTNPDGAKSGQPLVFGRPYPDGSAKIGRTIVQSVSQVAGNGEEFGYNATLAFEDVKDFDAREPETP